MFKHLAAVAAGLMIALVLPAEQARAQTLATPAPSDNGNDGVMFDVNATNLVTVTGLANDFDAGPQTVKIYTRVGTHVGFDSSSAGWTLIATVTLAGNDTVQAIPATLNVPIPAGQSQAFYIATDNGLGYRNGTGVGAVAASDANIQILEGTGKEAPDFNASSFTPRVFVGSVTYTPGLIAPPAPIPTLSEWAMILLGLTLAGGAVLYIRRRHALLG